MAAVTALLPRPLQSVKGPLVPDLAPRVVAGLGPRAGPSARLVARGIAPPAALTAMTLHLLSEQPRRPAEDGGERPPSVSGGVWVREQLTCHRPARIGELVEIPGELARRFTKKGRRFNVSTSRTLRADGTLLVSNATTGLERYRPDPDLGDGEEGRPDAEVAVPSPDPTSAAENPCLNALRALRTGETIEDPALPVPLELMLAWEGERSRNPIHSDPEAARRAGLDRPIAAGSQVLAFVQEPLMRELGDEALLYGAHFDARWVAPVRAGSTVTPRARVAAVSERELRFALEVACDGAVALVGRAVVPLPRAR